MAFNTKVDVADTELETNGAVAAEAEDVTLEDEALVEAESEDEADEDDEEADESEDSLTYSNGVIEKIVAMATREVPHVLGMKGNLMHFVQEQFGAENLTKGVTVEVTDDNRVVVNISVIIEYGAYAPAIFDDVKARVTERLAAMTGLEVAGVNLRIEAQGKVIRYLTTGRDNHPVGILQFENIHHALEKRNFEVQAHAPCRAVSAEALNDVGARLLHDLDVRDEHQKHQQH